MGTGTKAPEKKITMKFILATGSKPCSMLLFAFFIALSVPAQTISPEMPGEPGIDYVRLSRLDTLVKGYIQRDWMKQVVTIVVKDNRIVQYKGYGIPTGAGGKGTAPNTLFRLASQTKALVSAGLMMLYEEGKFRLDENISDFIPEFKNPVVLDSLNPKDSTYSTRPAKREITFRDLLTHTSGIDYPGIGSEKMKAVYAKAGIPPGLGIVDLDLLQTVKKLAKLPLKHDPGTQWTYGLSVDVIGCLIELMSGKDLETFLSERLFKPLGMNDTYFNVPVSKAPRLASVFTEDSAGRTIPWDSMTTKLNQNYPLAKKRYFSGGAGATGTAYDYAIFLQMMLNKGIYNGVRILSPRTVELMLSPQLDFSFGAKDNFGLGFQLTTAASADRNARNAGSFSWGGFWGTTYWADPKAKLICLVMTQQIPNHHGDLAPTFEQILYSCFK